MKAKFVFEYNFERRQNPKDALKLGERSIENFEIISPKKRKQLKEKILHLPDTSKKIRLYHAVELFIEEGLSKHLFLKFYLSEKEKIILFKIFAYGYDIASYFSVDDEILPDFKAYGWTKFYSANRVVMHQWIFTRPNKNIDPIDIYASMLDGNVITESRNFERNLDPKETLKIGIKQKADKLFGKKKFPVHMIAVNMNNQKWIEEYSNESSAKQVAKKYNEKYISANNPIELYYAYLENSSNYEWAND